MGPIYEEIFLLNRTESGRKLVEEATAEARERQAAEARERRASRAADA